VAHKGIAAMKRYLLLFLLSAATYAQNFVTITASNIQSGGNVPVAAGTIIFSATDATGKPISYQAGGGGQVIRTPVSCSISNGVIADNCKLANTDLTNPLHVCFNTIVKDSSNVIVLGGPGSGYNCVQPQSNNAWCTAGTCNFDSYSPGPLSVAPALLRTPGPTTLGGIFAVSCANVATQKVVGYDTNGLPICGTDQSSSGGGISYGTTLPSPADVFTYFTLTTPAANPGLYECTTSPQCTLSSHWTLIGPGSATIWGAIGGRLADQSDLQAALDAKLNVNALQWGSINGPLANQTDLQSALNAKPNTSSLAPVATTNDYNVLNNKPLIPGTTASFTMELEAPSPSDSGKFMWSGSPVNIRITDITCTTDTGIVAINFEVRSASAWNNPGTSIISGPMQCSSTPVSQTNFAVSNVSATSPLALMVPATSGLPSVIRVRVTYQVTQ
jgi:hypothetical protein